MGSEMCIRDSREPLVGEVERDRENARVVVAELEPGRQHGHVGVCLLYTSDAADERSSVDLGGRRIIKKQKKHNIDVSTD